MLKNKRGRIFTYCAIVFVLSIGVSLRAQELVSRNFLFLLDQGRDMMVVKRIIFDGHLTLIGPSTSLGGVFQGPLWYYLLAIFTGTFGGDPWGGILLMFIISISVLFVVFFWMKNLCGEKTAFITFSLFSLSSEAAAAATYAWNPHPMWLLVTVYIFSFYCSIYKSSRFIIILWPTIGLMFHFQTALAVFILLATVIYILIFEKKILLNKNFLIGIVLFLLTFAPQLLFDVRHNFLMLRSAFNFLKGSGQGLFVGGEENGYLYLIGNHAASLLDNFRSAFINDGFAKYIAYLSIILILFSVLMMIKNKQSFGRESNFILLLARLLIIIFLLTFFYRFPLRYWFLTGFQSFYLVWLGLLLSKFLTERVGKIIVVTIFSTLIFFSLQRINTLYFNPPNDGGREKIKGKLKAIDYIYQDSQEKPFGLLIFTPAVYTYTYDYLILWYGVKKYNYLPYTDKKDIFYLLIEPDSSKIWSYKGWLETVVKNGQVLKTTILPSGLIVQKRSI